MLYLTTRDLHDTFTAHRALTEDTAPNGGLYIPLKLPFYDPNGLESLCSKGFCEVVAEILNHFFSLRISPWAVEVCMGRKPVKIANAGRKVLVAEAWYNPDSHYEYFISQLNGLLAGIHETVPRSWLRVAVSVAFVFGIYGEMLQCGHISHEESFDACVTDGDLSFPTALIYARQMGLPIHNVVICSRDNSAYWDLINHGQLFTNLLQPQQKLAVERILCALLGTDQVASYVAACQRHGVYSVDSEKLDILPQSLFASVVGNERIQATVNNVYKSNGYYLCEDAAVCYGGIQDYRAKTGQGGPAVLFGLNAPKK